MRRPRLTDNMLLATLKAVEQSGGNESKAARAIGIPVGVLRYRQKEAKQRGLAETGEEARLWELYVADRSDVTRRNELVERFIPFAEFITQRIGAGLGGSWTQGDLRSLAYEGLIQAVQRYEPARGVKFTSYAGWRIRGAILDGLQDADPVGRNTRLKMKQRDKVARRLEQLSGHKATDEELAEVLGWDGAELARCAAGKDVSIDSARTVDAAGVGQGAVVVLRDLLAGRDESRTRRERRDLWELVTFPLDVDQRTLLFLYYDRGLTMLKIGEIFGYSESRISQLHSEAVDEIRRYIRSDSFVWPRAAAWGVKSAG